MKTKSFTTTIICGALFVLTILLVKIVDVQPVGPDGTAVGLATINTAVERLFCPTAPDLGAGNTFWYHLSEVTGTIALILAGLFAVLGAIELVQRKRLLKVDRALLALAILYIATMCAYALFEIVIINHRPVIMPGEAEVEASFPSSHTMLSIVIYGSAIPMFHKYLKSERLARVLHIACLILMAVTICARLLAGVHWLSDILGGIFLALTLLSLFLREIRP